MAAEHLPVRNQTGTSESVVHNEVVKEGLEPGGRGVAKICLAASTRTCQLTSLMPTAEHPEYAIQVTNILLSAHFTTKDKKCLWMYPMPPHC